MRVRAAVGGFDCSGVVLVESATVKQDSTEAISTAEVTVFQKYGTARYDSAEYDRAAFNEFAVNEWDELVLWDQDTTQLLFAGFILSVQRAIEGPHLRLTLAAADWGILFERALITQSWPDGTPDSTIIADALAQVPALSAGTIVTQVVPLTKFYKAEDYHQEYFKLHGSQPYCQLVIAPKVAKFRKLFHDQLK